MSKLKINMSKSTKLKLLSILVGFVVGGIILAIAGYNPFLVYAIMIKGIFSRPKYIAYTIIKATPLIITGLAVAFAFRTGLFNIGAEGQFITGAIVATTVGYFISLPGVLHPIVVLVAAIVAGAIWGSIAGFLKAKFGVHEVISTIMLNWIAFYLNNYIVALPSFESGSNMTYDIQHTASMEILGRWKASEQGMQWLSEHPALRDIFKTNLNVGIFVAIILVVIIYYILNKTTLGYQLRAVGFNRDAAEYSGINVPKNIVVSMAIAGGLAGAAGGIHIMGVSQNLYTLAAMEGYGFDGIAVALIGGNTPVGCLFSGLLYGALKYGGTKIQAPPVKAPTEVINIMIGIIIIFIAMPTIVDEFNKWKRKRRGEKNA